MKLLLFADGDVGLRIAEFLIAHYPDDLALVVTTSVNAIHDRVQAKGIAVCVYTSELAIADWLPAGVELGVLAWWPKLIREPLLSFPTEGFVNTHPSLLPYNRGKHYNFWSIVEESPSGVTLHRVDAGVDTGDIVAQREVPCGWVDTGGSLYVKAQEAMVALFCDSYPALRAGGLKSTPQYNARASFHHSSEIEMASRIDLDAAYKGREILNLLRARSFPGKPGCWFEAGGSRYEISIDIKKVNHD
jgi:methionyl-tRNA formyltransferase